MAERLYLFPDGRREGPFDETEVRAMLELGQLSFNDACQPANGARRFRLGDLFEIDEPDDAEDEAALDESEAEESAPGAAALLFVGHPSLLNHPLAWLMAIGAGVGGYLLGPRSLAYFAIGSLMAVATLVWLLVDRTTRVYLVSARRVEVVRGLVVKSSNEMRVRDIRAINVRRRGWRGLLGIGTVEFSSAGDNCDVAFEDIRGARRVKRLVRALQDRAQADGD